MQAELFERVHQAFRFGRQRAPSNAYSAAGRHFAALLKETVQRQARENEVAVVEALWQQQGLGILAARRDELDKSIAAFDEVRGRLQASVLSEEGTLLVQTLLDPAEAYYRYKRDDYRRARELVMSGVSINHRLSDTYRYGLLSAQRMQLCHNILRITTREGRCGETVRLAAAYMDYLEYGSEPLPDEIEWAWVQRAAFPDSIAQFYFDQVCGEAALALTGSSDGRLFALIADHATRPSCAGGFATHGHSWISVTRCCFDRKFDEYLDGACALLELGRTAEPSLWYATIFDVAATCRVLGPSGLQVADAIAEEMSQSADAPWIFTRLPAQQAG